MKVSYPKKFSIHSWIHSFIHSFMDLVCLSKLCSFINWCPWQIKADIIWVIHQNTHWPAFGNILKIVAEICIFKHNNIFYALRIYLGSLENISEYNIGWPSDIEGHIFVQRPLCTIYSFNNIACIENMI